MEMMPSTVRRENTSLQGADQLIAVPPTGPRLDTLPTIPPREESGPVPLSFTQERLWFLEQISPGDASGTISRAIKITGELKHDLVQRALQAIVNRHESLRTTFATNQLYSVRDSKPVQLIAANRTLEIPVIDLSHEPLNQREAKARDLAQSAAQRPFDLTLGPLLRATLFRLGEGEHVLLLSVHRIICDDSSLQILIDELWAAYKAFANEGAWSNVPLHIQYADYALWQRTLIEDESPAFDFWRANLQGAPTVIELPTDRPRPPVRSWHGESVWVNVENELVESLQTIGAREGATLPIVLLAAFNVVLARHSRQDDLVVGYTVSNCASAETKHLVGPLSSLLSLRTSLSGDPTFPELLSRLQNTTLEAQAHFVPFEKLLEKLELEPSLSHTPVFQVSFSFQKNNDPTEAPGLKLQEFEFDDRIARFDLALEIFEDSNHLDCRFRYSTDVFDHPTIARLGTHFKTVLEGIVSNPNRKISVLPLLAPAERKQILVDWNQTATFFPDVCLHELIAEQGRLRSQATALVYQGEEISYGELERRANQLAHHLQRLGVGPEVLVGICLERTPRMVVALLGVLKAGGAYLPLDPKYPLERLSFMLKDAAVKVLLSEPQLQENLAPLVEHSLCLDEEWERVASESETAVESAVTPDNLAYVIYTSGSTGQPKGVMITHHSLSNYLSWARETYQLSEGAGAALHSSISFDLSVTSLFGPLLSGKCLELLPPQEQVEELQQALEQGRDYSLVKLTPAHLQLLREQMLKAELGSSARRYVIGGENLEWKELQWWSVVAPQSRFYNEYGPTETVVGCSVYEVTPPVATTDGSVPIGRPIANTEMYILDEALEPVPVGVSGEIYIGGAGLARGYANRPELTAKAFVPNPFSAAAGARLYKTGDLARYQADGNIEYLGRIDNQVKVRGFRIELGEIEAVLRGHSLVQNVAVVVRQGNLLAYVVPSSNHRHSDRGKLWNELRSFLKTKLPEYMSPAIFVALDALPLTPNGKVDRRALPAPDESRRDLEQAYVAPRNQLEEQLAALWANVLQLKSIGIRDNFFELGGNSLLAARLFAQIENRFGKHLPLSTLFRFPTIEQLANSLHDSDTSKPWSSLVAIQPEGSRPPLFCVHAAGANVLIYRPLSRHLGNDQPVYALQAQGLDGRTSPLTTVEDMAALYIEEMRAVQPQGPYFLLGASFGGLVIYEMAQQLLAARQEVALLAMLNTNCPVYTLAKRMRCHLGHLMEYGPRRYATEVSKSVKRRLTGQVIGENNGSRKTNAPDPDIQKLLVNDSGVDESLVRTVTAILAADERYVPARQEYPGKITFFWARDAKSDFEDNRLGWRRLAAGGFDLHVVPGTHTSMREEPYVAELVEKLKPCLENANLQTRN
jgi:amino acid adenylation domain-containing protein